MSHGFVPHWMGRYASFWPGVTDSTPSAEMSAKLLEGLLNKQRNGLWGNTQENVFGMMAIATLSGADSADTSRPELELSVGQRRLAADTLETVSPRLRRLELDESELELTAGVQGLKTLHVVNHGQRAMHISVRTTHELTAEAYNGQTRANGFELKRSYQTLAGEQLAGEIELGSLVLVRVRVTAHRPRAKISVFRMPTASLSEPTRKVNNAMTVAQTPMKAPAPVSP